MTGNHHDERPAAAFKNGNGTATGADTPHPSMVREYFGTEPRNLLYLGGLLLGVMVLVTVPYVMLVGFGKWSNDMREAGHMIWAGYTPANDWRPLGTTPLLGGAGSFVPVGRLGAPVGQVGAPAPVPAGGAAGFGRLYVCPTCGAMGGPAWTAMGQPMCPLCGGMMCLSPWPRGLDLAASSPRRSGGPL